MIPGAFGSETTKIGIADRIARRVVDRVVPTARRAALETAGGRAGAEGSNRTIRVHNDPGVVWFRKLIARIFLRRDPSTDPSSPIFES
jgi:hypothetical protein